MVKIYLHTIFMQELWGYKMTKSLYKVGFNVWIDKESHPNITNKQSAIAVAKSLTNNEVGSFDWDKEAEGLLFKEYIYFETEETNKESQAFCSEIDDAQAKCQCPEPEFCYVQKVRKRL